MKIKIVQYPDLVIIYKDNKIASMGQNLKVAKENLELIQDNQETLNHESILQ